MKNLLYLSISILFLSACSKESVKEIYTKPQGCDSIAFSYNNDISPIIQANCNLSACHAVGGDGSYDYTNYAVVADRIRSGRFIERLLLPVDDPLHMPVGIKMNSCEQYRLITWIQQGFPNN